jgi:hypothetical protein
MIINLGYKILIKLKQNLNLLPKFLMSAYRHVSSMMVKRFAHGHAVPKSSMSLLDTMKLRMPGNEAVVTKRIEQLKRNHSKQKSD